MKEAIKDFRERLRSTGDNSVRLFYYAGHGVEARGQNYLIPIGADIRNEVDFLTDAVPLDWVLARMESANNSLNIVILDACRNNPYGEERGGSRGLAPIIAPSGTFISYAAAPGQAALDGEGEDNSPYSAALARTLVKPELQIEDVFKHVRAAVMKATDNRQGPWEAGSLMGEFYFVETKGKPNVDLGTEHDSGQRPGAYRRRLPKRYTLRGLMACHEFRLGNSYVLCRFCQCCRVIPRERASRNAVSALTPR